MKTAAFLRDSEWNNLNSPRFCFLAYTHQNASFKWNKANSFSNYFKNNKALPKFKKNYGPRKIELHGDVIRDI